MKKSLRELAEWVGGGVIGDGEVEISGVAALEEARTGEIAFIANPRYLSKLNETRASAVIVSKEVAVTSKPLLTVANPYLAFAVMLKGGLDGIHQKMNPPTPVEEDVYEFDESALQQHCIETLPGSLSEALAELKKDKVIQEVLGSHTYPIYLAAKKAEYDEYRLRVTSWELEKYFETT